MKDFNINKVKNDEYYTPNYVLDHFCDFDYDPCTTIERAKIHNIKIMIPLKVMVYCVTGQNTNVYG